MTDKRAQLYAQAVVLKDDPRIPAERTFIVEKDVMACPWCGTRRVMIRPQLGGMFSDPTQPAQCTHAAQCTCCGAWGPRDGSGASICRLMSSWNWRRSSWRSYRFRIRRWWYYRWMRIKKWALNLSIK